MYTLKMLGLVVLAGMSVVAFIVGYDYFQGLSASEEAKEQADLLDKEIEDMISKGVVGEDEEVSIDIPGDYTLQFESNQLVMDGIRLPEGGYDSYDNLTVDGPEGELGPGKHELLITLKSDEIQIREVD